MRLPIKGRCNKKSGLLQFWTLGDKPSGQPLDLKVQAPSSTSLLLHWSDPQRSQWNGAILGYRAGWRRMRYVRNFILSAEAFKGRWLNEHVHNVANLCCFIMSLQAIFGGNFLVSKTVYFVIVGKNKLSLAWKIIREINLQNNLIMLFSRNFWI